MKRWLGGVTLVVLLSCSLAALLDEASSAAQAADEIRLSGHGRMATQPITLPASISVATLTHNGRSNFIVKTFQGDHGGLLVNEIGSYAGSRPLTGTE
ncbi:MAG: hypothetical protein ACRDTD_24395, partial [Pseudonocardiaceae bacterium]